MKGPKLRVVAFCDTCDYLLVHTYRAMGEECQGYLCAEPNTGPVDLLQPKPHAKCPYMPEVLHHYWLN